MAIEIKVPSPGESVTEVQIANWLKSTGDYVQKDEEICEIDSDKATLTVSAEEAGQLTIAVEAGETVNVGDIIATIDTSVAAPEGAAAPVATKAEEPAKEEKKSAPTPAAAPTEKSYAAGTPSPAARKIIEENNLSKVQGTGPGGRITKTDALNALSTGFSAQNLNTWTGGRDTDSQKMTMLRKKIAQRLVSVKNETAMLTTFNEVDMTAILELRKKYKDKFEKKHGIGLGFMSFFTKAVTEALYHFPAVNAYIDGENVVYNKFVDVGIAVSTPKGLMVPVLRNAELLSLAGIEAGIKDVATRARDGKLTIEEMTGGTFTITNGGVFGSLLSTPIINPPQSGILGMHKIQERPVAINGKVEIRPMMYLAFSYDHRIIDGKESVSFLVKVKDMLENPAKMIFGGRDPEEVLFDLL
jgi:2-oxoglutarate dehydrogenase E2 component (dihydrolipoamide succinyltransferase)